ncbi:MAG: Ig-like domain-containing protein, partial [Verrucomicrobiota bacterium]|nr:Ig-like domain-containing protein [Verrucomicrobiota bacterium]
DSDGEVTQVEILGGDESLASLSEAPYEADWTPAKSGMQTLTVRATDNDGATSEATVSVAVYSETPVPVNGLRLWLDAGEGLTAGDDGMVSAWADRSLFGHDVSQAEAAQQPRLVADAVNSREAVLFDGEDDMLAREDVAGEALLSSDSVSVYAVVRQKSQSDVNTALAWEGPDYSNHLALLTSYNNQFLVDHGHASEGGRVSAAQPEGWDDAWHVLEFVRDGNQAVVVVDSEALEMGEFEDALEVDVAGRLIVGAVPELAFGGEIAEVLIYNRALSESERGAVRGYLGASYGLFVTDNQAPVVTFTAPNLGATVKQGDSLLLKAEAVDADGNVVKVLFFSGGTELGLDESAPYELEWTPTAEGEHLLTAVALDNRGGETISDVVTVTVLPPTDPIAPTLLSSATVNGEYTAEPEVALDEDNKTFTVKRSGDMRFYRLRSADEAKLKVTSIRVQDGDAVIAYEIVEE